MRRSDHECVGLVYVDETVFRDGVRDMRLIEEVETRTRGDDGRGHRREQNHLLLLLPLSSPPEWVRPHLDDG